MNTITEQYEKYINTKSEDDKVKIIESSIPYIEKMVGRFENGRVIEKQDLFQEGVFGVIKTIESGCAPDVFEKKLHANIKCFVLKYGINSGPVILNQNAQQKISLINKFKDQYYEKTGSEPSEEEISKGTGIPRNKLSQINYLLSPPESLQENSLETDPHEETINNEIVEKLMDILNLELSQEEQFIIKSKYGIGCEKLSLEEIGSKTEKKFCKQRIDQKHKAILHKLKRKIKNLV